MLEDLRTFIRHGKQAVVDEEAGRQGSGAAGGNQRRGSGVDPYQPRVHHVQDYTEVARNLVRRENALENEIKQRNRRSIEKYSIGSKIGEGAFSTVYKAMDVDTGERVAVKAIRKEHLDAKQRAAVLKEVGLMRQLNHPNIVKLIDFIETEQFFYIVQELVTGGEIFNQVVKFTYFSEDLSRHVIIQVAEAILYMHEAIGIVHRDLKPENIFFKPIKMVPSEQRRLRRSDDPNAKVDEGVFRMNRGGGGIGEVKIGDFGLSKQVSSFDQPLKTPCGTLGYTAPEIVNDMKYSKEVDMWALGCVLYILLCGFPPFFNDNIEELTKKVALGQYEFLKPWWDEISDGAKNCVSHLLTVDPLKRYTIEEFMNDPWIMEFLQRSESARGVQASANAQYWELPTVESQPDRTGILPRYESTADATEQSAAPDGQMYSPAVIAMRDAMDITNAAHRLNEEQRDNVEKRMDENTKQFELKLDDSSILQRRRQRIR